MALRNAEDYMQSKHPGLFSQVHAYVPDGEFTIVTPNEYVAIPGVWAAARALNWTVSEAGIVTLTGLSAWLFYSGIGSIAVSKASTVIFATFKNGVETTTTEMIIPAPGVLATRNIVRTGLLNIATNDYFQIFVKSDTANNVITHKSVRLIFNR